MENVLPGYGMIRVSADPRPLEIAELVHGHSASDDAEDARPFRDTPFYLWNIAEASQLTTPPLPPIKTLRARWVFSHDDNFVLLLVAVESYELDSQVAAALTFAAEAAQMAGWRPQDSRDLNQWLEEVVTATPYAELTSAQARYGFTRVGFERRRSTATPSSRLSLVPTAHSLGGRPLDAEGREVWSPDPGDA